jgi:ribosomal protein L11 methyltransferase
LGDRREWPALIVRSRGPAPALDAAALEDVLVALLDDYSPSAIEHLEKLPLPPGGIWDKSFAPLPESIPPTLAWRVFFHDRTARDRAAMAIRERHPELDLTPEEIDDEDWAARSQQNLQAITAGDFIVAPPWDLPPPGLNVIVIEPSRGFGTGHHASTRLCLRAMSAIDFKGRSVVDLGTGSGVLAMGAALLGARAVTAIDIDPDAIEAARHGLSLNRLPIEIDFRIGDFRQGELGDSRYDVVLANLTGGMIIGAASKLMQLLAAGGTLVVSGFDEDDRATVEAALCGLDVRAIYTDEGWVGLTVQSGQALP